MALLKSAPPVWAGTIDGVLGVTALKLKSAPPVWAGTISTHSLVAYPVYLNPPRPCGRGLRYRLILHVRFRLKSAPPVWAGTVLQVLSDSVDGLKSAPPVWAGTVLDNALCTSGLT